MSQWPANQLPKPETLFDRVMYCLRFDCIKHGHAKDPDEWAASRIDALSNTELLREISDALDAMEQAAIEAAPVEPAKVLQLWWVKPYRGTDDDAMLVSCETERQVQDLVTAMEATYRPTISGGATPPAAWQLPKDYELARQWLIDAQLDGQPYPIGVRQLEKVPPTGMLITPGNNILSSSILHALAAYQEWDMERDGPSLKDELDIGADSWLGGAGLLAMAIAPVVNELVDYDYGVFTYDLVEITGPMDWKDRHDLGAFLMRSISTAAWVQISDNYMVPNRVTCEMLVRRWVNEHPSEFLRLQGE